MKKYNKKQNKKKKKKKNVDIHLSHVTHGIFTLSYFEKWEIFGVLSTLSQNYAVVWSNNRFEKKKEKKKINTSEV